MRVRTARFSFDIRVTHCHSCGSHSPWTAPARTAAWCGGLNFLPCDGNVSGNSWMCNRDMSMLDLSFGVSVTKKQMWSSAALW